MIKYFPYLLWPNKFVLFKTENNPYMAIANFHFIDNITNTKWTMPIDNIDIDFSELVLISMQNRACDSPKGITFFHDAICLKFDDIVESVSGMRCFDDKMAKYIADFIRKYKDRGFVFQCAAGISRSSAVASIASQFILGFDMINEIGCPDLFEPNRLVKKLLGKQLGISI